MSTARFATEVVFLPGFDGAAELRSDFLAALGEQFPTRAIGYPNRKMDTLNGYARHVAERVGAQSRPVLVAESFSGLVAARWAAMDPHVAGIVLCGAFARSPIPWLGLGASFPTLAQLFILYPAQLGKRDAARRRWSDGFAAAIRSLDPEVVAERLRLIATEDVGAELRSLRIPIVVMQFLDDQVIGPGARDELETACPNARLVRIPGPHFSIAVRPRESAEAIREHVAEMFPAGSARP
jgi:pimeloyl-ACP methyl ester carboxylesterase